MNKKGQSSIEYMILTIVILAAFLALGTYFKRGMQGRWASIVDDLGDQYDPRFANTRVLHTISMNTDTEVYMVDDNVADGKWTKRIDYSNTVEKRIGFTGVAAY